MVSIQQYQSPLGGILLAADEVGLVGLWFEGQKYFANTLPVGHCAQTTPILAEAKRWLDIYFAGKEPDFLPPLHPVGSSFQQSVWKILLTIPYGQIITYGDIARQLAAQQGGRADFGAVCLQFGGKRDKFITTTMPILNRICRRCKIAAPARERTFYHDQYRTV